MQQKFSINSFLSQDKLGDRLLSAVENIKENSAKEDFINTIRFNIFNVFIFVD